MYIKDPPDQKENNWVWSPQWEVQMHKPELWGYVQVGTSGGDSVRPVANHALSYRSSHSEYASHYHMFLDSAYACQPPSLQTPFTVHPTHRPTLVNLLHTYALLPSPSSSLMKKAVVVKAAEEEAAEELLPPRQRIRPSSPPPRI